MNLLSGLLFPKRESAALVERATDDALLLRMNPRALTSLSVEVATLLPFEDPLVSAALTEARRYKNQKACSLLGGVLATYLQRRVSESDAYEHTPFVLVPIPPQKKHRRDDYVKAITKIALARLHLDAHISPLLLRVKDTPPSFAALPIRSNRTYILINDTATTATLTGAVRALQEAGAIHIIGVALAHWDESATL